MKLRQELQDTNLSLPSTLQYIDGPSHDVAGQKKSSGPKQEKLQSIKNLLRTTIGQS